MIDKEKKEEIKRVTMEKMNTKIEEYIENMDKESNNDTFPISKIEEMWGQFIDDAKTIIHDITEEAVNEIDEQMEINKKTEYKEKGVKLQIHQKNAKK